MNIQVFEKEVNNLNVNVQIIHMKDCFYFNITDGSFKFSNLHYSVPSNYVIISIKFF